MHIHLPGRQVVTILRGGLWIVSFYMLGLLCKIYYQSGVDIKNAVNVLGIGIFFFTLFVMDILRQTRHEDDPKRQSEHILRVMILLAALYGFCCLLAFSLSGKWTFPHLWF